MQKLIENSDNIVFFGGAGVSTESGIPDFRSESGIYSAISEFGCPPETILSHTFFMNNPEKFYKFYKTKMIYPSAKPNAAHIKLAALERAGKLRAVITQNIDNLHQLAGSRNVLELHGSVYRNYCMDCRAFYDLEYIMNADGVPHCAHCGGIVKPDVVLYEEGLDTSVITAAVSAIAAADVLIVGGTSLSVYPAAGLIDYYKGNKLVLINKSPTTYDKRADLLLRDSIGSVFEKLVI